MNRHFRKKDPFRLKYNSNSASESMVQIELAVSFAQGPFVAMKSAIQAIFVEARVVGEAALTGFAAETGLGAQAFRAPARRPGDGRDAPGRAARRLTPLAFRSSPVTSGR